MRVDFDRYEMVINKSTKLKKSEFINRELSWLSFNRRVLYCANNSHIPLGERLNFLGICESNLDEFISVRLPYAANPDNEQPYGKILKGVHDFLHLQELTYKELKRVMNKETGIAFKSIEEAGRKHIDMLKDVFDKRIYPILTPIELDSNDLNMINGLSYIGVKVRTSKVDRLVVIPLLPSLDFFYIIGKTIYKLEDIITYFMEDNLFINQDVVEHAVFRLIKDGSVLLDHEESTFVVDRMNRTLNKRKNADPIFMEIKKGCSSSMKKTLIDWFKVKKENVYTGKRLINYKALCREKILPNLLYEPFKPFKYTNAWNRKDMFEVLDAEDVLLQHPYDSYDTVINFIQHAANDPDVESIRHTIYRVSGIDSPIINALCDAGRNGKFVTVLVEIKARFDEANNIQIIKKLKDAGVNVVLGDEYLKTHCKMCIVTKKVGDMMKLYAHVGTGNYNEQTAKIYTDLSYLTSKQKICRDLIHVFNIISGHSKQGKDMEKVFYSPVNLRKRLESRIEKEMKYGKDGRIFIKVNSLSDVRIVSKLYEAAKAGVKIKIICRGICSIVPIKNIEVKSIVGRFLEHSRIYYFAHGNSGDTPAYYIGSADLLPRNLDNRVETLISVSESNIIEKLDWIIDTLSKDTRNSFFEINVDELDDDPSAVMELTDKWVSWVNISTSTKSKDIDGLFDAHQYMIDHTCDM